MEIFREIQEKYNRAKHIINELNCIDSNMTSIYYNNIEKELKEIVYMDIVDDYILDEV